MTAPTIRIELQREISTLRFFIGDDPVTNVEWDLREEKDLDPEILERKIGYAILGMFSAIVGQSVGTRDYLSDRNNRTPLILEWLRHRVESGEHSAIVSMALEMVASARRNRDVKDIEKAEEFLRDAALRGNKSAIEYLSSGWPAEKADALVAIRGKSG